MQCIHSVCKSLLLVKVHEVSIIFGCPCLHHLIRPAKLLFWAVGGSPCSDKNSYLPKLLLQNTLAHDTAAQLYNLIDRTHSLPINNASDYDVISIGIWKHLCTQAINSSHHGNTKRYVGIASTGQKSVSVMSLQTLTCPLWPHDGSVISWE